jgi:hypothetical protein
VHLVTHPKPPPLKPTCGTHFLVRPACHILGERQKTGDKERASVIFFRSPKNRGDGGGAGSADEVGSGSREEWREGGEVDAHTRVAAEGQDTDRGALATSTGARSGHDPGGQAPRRREEPEEGRIGGGGWR